MYIHFQILIIHDLIIWEKIFCSILHPVKMILNILNMDIFSRLNFNLFIFTCNLWKFWKRKLLVYHQLSHNILKSFKCQILIICYIKYEFSDIHQNIPPLQKAETSGFRVWLRWRIYFNRESSKRKTNWGDGFESYIRLKSG